MKSEAPMVESDMQGICDRIRADPRYLANVQYGQPRRGHAEGTVAAHIAQLEANLVELAQAGRVSDAHYWKLMVLIHVHDTFKAETAALGRKNCPIEDPHSHASLAREYLAQFTDDADILRIVQYHDLGYAVYRNFKDKGRINEARLAAGLGGIADKQLYLLFCIIDACTPSKGREMIRWLVGEVRKRFPDVAVTEEWILPGPEMVGDAW